MKIIYTTKPQKMGRRLIFGIPKKEIDAGQIDAEKYYRITVEEAD